MVIDFGGFLFFYQLNFIRYKTGRNMFEEIISLIKWAERNILLFNNYACSLCKPGCNGSY